MYKILKLNNIAKEGIESFPKDTYIVENDITDPDAIILRSFDMRSMDIPSTLKAVGRAGTGVNNIPVEKLTDLAVPVFNAPGANANAVKELVIAAILICARNILQARTYIEKIDESKDFDKEIEFGKKQYVGYELPGKTIGIIGLGSIGVRVANTCLNLGMNVVGFDPLMTVQSAWNLQPGIEKSDHLEKLLKQSDIISIHIPLTDNTKDFINTEELSAMKNDSILINLSRAEIVNNNAIQTALNKKNIKTYVTDFPDKTLLKNDNVFLLPHLGASTKEAEIKCAKMVAMSLKSFIEDGNINHSVNFPEVQLARTTDYRLSITNQNRPNIVGQFTTSLGERNININDLSHKNYNNIGYTVLDVDKPLTDKILQSISQIEGVIAAKNLSKNTQ